MANLGRVVLLLVLVGLTCFSASPSRADGISPPPLEFLPASYDVNGTLTITGNDVCSGMPCTETIDFSFDYGYAFYPGIPGYYPYVSDLAATASGALPFTESFAGPGLLNPNEGVFLALDDPAGDEFDIFFAQFFVLTPVAPQISVGDLYSCLSDTCVTDFDPAAVGQPPITGPVDIPGLFVFGPVQATVTPIPGPPTIPEPSTLSLLMCGLFLLALAAASNKSVGVNRSSAM